MAGAVEAVAVAEDEEHSSKANNNVKPDGKKV